MVYVSEEVIVKFQYFLKNLQNHAHSISKLDMF